LSIDEIKELLKTVKDSLQNSDFDADSLQITLNDLLAKTGQKPVILFSLIRFAVSWAPFSPALNDTLATLGRDRVLARLEAVIATAV